ncbi:hypothetical protein MMC26_003681 [Xylographa opegraphella]|nr:hypothetical protein [Xylographa opegraphella]
MGLLGVIAVGSGLSQPKYWPPVFGPLQEAYSLRRFWGSLNVTKPALRKPSLALNHTSPPLAYVKLTQLNNRSIFWHKLQQQKMSGPASFLTYRILRLPPRTQVSQLTHLFWTFFISGLMHTFSDLGRGIPWKQSGALQFFLTQVVGIMIEDAVKKALRSMSGARKATAASRMTRGIGYLWVAAFLVWSVPVWIYPFMYIDRGEPKDRIIQYSVVRLLMKKW